MHKNRPVMGIVLGLLTLALSVPAAFAQVGVPQGYTAMPLYDDGRADDVVMQLNNLTVQGVDPATRSIYASQSSTIYCTRYESAQSSTGFRAPCPSLGPTVLYRIVADYDAILLFRNRTRATFNDFTPGDHINVYGFMDADSNMIHGLIVRNLDKPLIGVDPVGGGYLQINNVQVLSSPSGSTFYVLTRDYGCTSYGYGGVSRGAAVACPMGTDAASVQSTLGAAASSFYPYPSTGRIYRVEVMPGAQVLDLYRRPIALSSIQPGHYVNVYGYFTPSNATIQAQIVRDLSPNGTPNPVPVNATLTVEVIDQAIRCITTPCGQMNNVTVSVFRSGGAGYVGVTTGGKYTFKDLMPGTYTVRASYPSYGETTQTVVLSSGENRNLTLYLSGSGGCGSIGYPCPNPGFGVSVIRPNGGETLVRSQMSTIEWRFNPDPLAIYPQGAAFDVYAVSESQTSYDTVASIRYAIARNIGWTSSGANREYIWNVGQNLENLYMYDGAYKIMVCPAGSSSGCDMSDSSFRIGGTQSTQVRLNSLEPWGGVPGTNLTIRGTGFHPTNNVVRFGDVEYNNLASADGMTLVVPGVGWRPWSCPAGYGCATVMQPLPAGNHAVSVRNPYGISNSLNFLLYSQSYITGQ